MNAARTLLVAMTLAMSAYSGSVASADHDTRYATIASHAEEISCASRELNEELRYRFHDSRLYGDLLATNARIRSKASYLLAQARPSRHVETCQRFLADLEQLVCRMDGLIDEASFRADRGIDRPIGRTRKARSLVENMREAVDCLKRNDALLARSEVFAPNDRWPPQNPGNWNYGGEWRPDSDTRRYYEGDDFRDARLLSEMAHRGVQWDRNGITIRAGDYSVQLHR